MKFLYVYSVLLLSIASSCNFKTTAESKTNPPSTTNQDTANYKRLADASFQSIPDKDYTGLSAGDDAPDVVKIEADHIERLINGVCVIEKEGQYALIDLKGHFLADWGKYYFEDATSDIPFFPLLVVKTKNHLGNMGMINLKGQEVFACKPQNNIGSFDALGVANFNGKLVDTNGRELGIKHIPYNLNNYEYRAPFGSKQYTEAIPTYETEDDTEKSPSGMVTKKMSKEQPIYQDLNGHEPFFSMFAAIGAFTEGLAPVFQTDKFGNGVWGFINTKGEIVIDPNFVYKPGNFHCGLAFIRAQYSGKAGFRFAYIDKKGNFKIKLGDVSGYKYEPDANGYFIHGYSFWHDYMGNIRLMDTAGTLRKLDEILKTPVQPKDESGLSIRKFDELGIYFTRSNRTTAAQNTLGMCDYSGNVIFPNVFADIIPDYHSHYTIANIKLPDIPNTNISQFKQGIINRQGVFVLLLTHKEHI